MLRQQKLLNENNFYESTYTSFESPCSQLSFGIQHMGHYLSFKENLEAQTRAHLTFLLKTGF